MTMLLSTNHCGRHPAAATPPIVLDMASTVSLWQGQAKAKRGEMMPDGWMIDRNGQSLTDQARR
jgi:LDH2 family malate/lactate/ureidoglycolate dehydrogenase